MIFFSVSLSLPPFLHLVEDEHLMRRFLMGRRTMLRVRATDHRCQVYEAHRRTDMHPWENEGCVFWRKIAKYTTILFETRWHGENKSWSGCSHATLDVQMSTWRFLIVFERISDGMQFFLIIRWCNECVQCQICTFNVQFYSKVDKKIPFNT